MHVKHLTTVETMHVLKIVETTVETMHVKRLTTVETMHVIKTVETAVETTHVKHLTMVETTHVKHLMTVGKKVATAKFSKNFTFVGNLSVG